MWLNMMKNGFYCQIRAPKATSDGIVIELNAACQQVSGQYLTTCTNGIIRQSVVYENYILESQELPTIPLAIAVMGDDCVEPKIKDQSVEKFKENYLRMVFVLTDVHDGENVEFCSKKFVSRSEAVPLGLAKSLVNLLSSEYTELNWTAFKREFRHLQPIPQQPFSKENVIELLRQLEWLPANCSSWHN